jgi:hypothetical protein
MPPFSFSPTVKRLPTALPACWLPAVQTWVCFGFPVPLLNRAGRFRQRFLPVSFSPLNRAGWFRLRFFPSLSIPGCDGFLDGFIPCARLVVGARSRFSLFPSLR